MNIKELLKTAAEKKASDLHLIVGLPPVLRIDGGLIFIDGQNKISDKEMEQMVLSLLDEKQKSTYMNTRELDIGVEIGNFRYRVNLHFQKNNMGLVARVINDRVPTLDEIRMPKIIYNLLDLKQGLILL